MPLQAHYKANNDLILPNRFLASPNMRIKLIAVIVRDSVLVSFFLFCGAKGKRNGSGCG